MATNYIPNESGWEDNGIFGPAARLRLKLESVYDPDANRSLLTLTLQSRAPNYSGRYVLLDNALLRLNGGTVFSGGGSGQSALGCYVDYGGDEGWYSLTDASSGQPLSWEALVEHDAAGAADVEAEVTVRFYREGPFYMTFYGVSGSVTLQETRCFHLTVNAAEGSTIIVRRSGTVISSGAELNAGDVLNISFFAQDGYTLAEHTVNGQDWSNGRPYTVDSDVTVATQTLYSTYYLAVSAGTGTVITVTRGSQTLGNGAELHPGDVLVIRFEALPGYVMMMQSVNGSWFDSGQSLRVAGPVGVTATARRFGQIRLDTGSALRPCRVLLDTGSAIVPTRLYLDLGDRYAEVVV